MTIKRVFTAVLVIASLASLTTVPWPVVLAWLSPTPATIQLQSEQTITWGFDGIIVYVDRNGQAPLYAASGWHDRELKLPGRHDALFKIASIGKLYHAVVVAKLVADGQLQTSATLAHYLPELAERIENANTITLEMLVQHRSGIPNYTDLSLFWASPPKNREQTLALVLDQPSDFSPGSDYAYSNTNYLLLGLIIERVTGQPKFSVIKERILTPLSLNNTFADIHSINSAELMSGYYVGFEQSAKTDYYGSMIASAADVAKFVRALNDGSLLSVQEQAIYADLYRFEHTGLVPGYQSIVAYQQESDTVIVQFTSTTDFDGYQWNLSQVSYDRLVDIVANMHTQQ